MHRLSLAIITLLLAAASLIATTGQGAEVVIRRQATPQRSLVVLGDIAAIYDIDPQRQRQLSQVELFPAPPVSRVLRLSELQEILNLRGVKLMNCRFSGSSTVTITVPQKVQQASFTPRVEPVSKASSGVAATQITQAIAAYVQQRTGVSGWEVKLLSNVYASALPPGSVIAQVAGGKAPWNGQQQFQIFAGQQPLQVTAMLSLPGMVVTATRSLRRGEVLRASDVTLTRLDKPTNASHTLSDVSQAIGKQVSKSIRSGAAIDQFSLQAPVLIHRRDAVTLWVRSAGVNIRMATRAMGQGAKGDTIVLQSIDGKRKYEAIVADYQTAEIIGQSLQTQRASQKKGL